MTGLSLRCGLIVLLILAAAVFGCESDTEKEKIQKTLSSIKTAAERIDAGGILDKISKTYHDPQNNDYGKIKALLLFNFLRYRSVKAVMTGLETDIQGDSANVRFQAVLSGRTGPSTNVLPDTLGAYRFTVLFARTSGKWTITSANWERIGDGFEKLQ